MKVTYAVCVEASLALGAVKVLSLRICGGVLSPGAILAAFTGEWGLGGRDTRERAISQSLARYDAHRCAVTRAYREFLRVASSTWHWRGEGVFRTFVFPDKVRAGVGALLQGTKSVRLRHARVAESERRADPWFSEILKHSNVKHSSHAECLKAPGRRIRRYDIFARTVDVQPPTSHPPPSTRKTL